MGIRYKSFAAALLIVTGATNGWAQTNSAHRNVLGQAGKWSIVAFKNQEGNFERCDMQTQYPSGAALQIAVTPSSVMIGAGHPRWNVRPKGNTSIMGAFSVDGKTISVGPVFAMQRDFFRAEMTKDAGLLDGLRSGNTLTIKVEGQAQKFSLNESGKALELVIDCANRKGDVPWASAGGKPAQKIQQAKSSELSEHEITVAQRIEATRFAANVLSMTNFKGYHMLSVSEQKKSEMMSDWFKTAAVAWNLPGDEGLYGAVHLYRGTRETLDRIVAESAAEDAGECTGDLLVNKGGESEENVRFISTGCRDNEGLNGQVSYIFTARPNGIVYRFGIFQIREKAPLKDKQQDIKGLQDVLKQASL